jgi:hypothetical protein
MLENLVLKCMYNKITITNYLYTLNCYDQIKKFTISLVVLRMNDFWHEKKILLDLKQFYFISI